MRLAKLKDILLMAPCWRGYYLKILFCFFLNIPIKSKSCLLLQRHSLLVEATFSILPSSSRLHCIGGSITDTHQNRDVLPNDLDLTTEGCPMCNKTSEDQETLRKQTSSDHMITVSYANHATAATAQLALSNPVFDSNWSNVKLAIVHPDNPRILNRPHHTRYQLIKETRVLGSDVCDP